MKKLLALLLCLILCLSLFACNASEEPTEAPTEAEKPTETDKLEPESKEMKISFVRNNKIVFPGKKIKYIKYEYKIYEYSEIPPTVTTTVSVWSDEAIFRTPEKIEQIVNFFKNAELSEGYEPPATEETYIIYFEDNTHAQIQVGKKGYTFCNKYLDENGEQIEEYYYIKDISALEYILGK